MIDAKKAWKLRQKSSLTSDEKRALAEYERAHPYKPRKRRGGGRRIVEADETAPRAVEPPPEIPEGDDGEPRPDVRTDFPEPPQVIELPPIDVGAPTPSPDGGEVATGEVVDRGGDDKEDPQAFGLMVGAIGAGILAAVNADIREKGGRSLLLDINDSVKKMTASNPKLVPKAFRKEGQPFDMFDVIAGEIAYVVGKHVDANVDPDTRALVVIGGAVGLTARDYYLLYKKSKEEESAPAPEFAAAEPVKSKPVEQPAPVAPTVQPDEPDGADRAPVAPIASLAFGRRER
jgi:hypothetical protein